MIERRKQKRVNYFASDENMQRCVMKAWKAVITRNELQERKFTIVGEENVYRARHESACK